jgi:MarR family transcriptional regulator, temperature-dependent positive regulator of motility
MSPPISDEVRYKLLAYLDERPNASQREAAACLGVSLGKVNYCLKALVERGWVKIGRFSKSSRKMSYAYVLTPKGIEEKIAVTYRFLKRKMIEYDALSVEIERLHGELRRIGQPDVTSSKD